MLKRLSSPYLSLGLSCVAFALAAGLGFALDGTQGAVRAVVVLFGVAMLAFSGFILNVAIRDKHSDKDWAFVGTLVALRAGAGLAALWLALGGGKTASWVLVGFVVAYPIWMQIMRRRRRGVA